jgi:crotonobetainyl-CoA:carnitine CoA-transferase CaiB-like acyl-CoA transferase
VEACFTPVLSIEEVMRHPHWQARGVFVEYDHPQAGRVTQLGPLGGGDTRGPAPDAEKSYYREVLASVGFAPEEIDELRACGVVR